MGKHKEQKNQKLEKKYLIDWSYFLSNVILTIVPTVWFSWAYPIVKNLSTIAGLISNIVLILIELYFVIRTSYKKAIINDAVSALESLKEKYDNLASDNLRNQKSLQLIIETSSLKRDILRDYLQKSYDNNDFSHIPEIITKPSSQINHMINQIHKSVCKLSGLNSKRVSVAVAIKCNIIHDWQWVDGFVPNSSLSPVELSKINSSTFYKVTIEQGKHYICYNSKIEAYKNQKYYEDVLSSEHINDGIIIAKHYFVQGNGTGNWAELIIFITTKNKYYIDSFDELGIENMLSTFVFDEYKIRMEIELMLYTLELLNTSSHNQNHNNNNKDLNKLS